MPSSKNNSFTIDLISLFSTRSLSNQSKTLSSPRFFYVGYDLVVFAQQKSVSHENVMTSKYPRYPSLDTWPQPQQTLRYQNPQSLDHYY